MTAYAIACELAGKAFKDTSAIVEYVEQRLGVLLNEREATQVQSLLSF